MPSEQGTVNHRTAEEGAVGTEGNANYATLSRAFPLSPGINTTEIVYETGAVSQMNAVTGEPIPDTSSFVVSRDNLRNFYNDHVCNGSISLNSDFGPSQTLDYQAVSYTHLTLPTICSV